MLALLASNPVIAADPYEALKALGQLNGIALHCNYLGEVQRMKAAVVASAPKERSYGLAFDQATNDGFLAFIRQGSSCPGQMDFSGRVDAAINELEKSFGKG